MSPPASAAGMTGRGRKRTAAAPPVDEASSVANTIDEVPGGGAGESKTKRLRTSARLRGKSTTPVEERDRLFDVDNDIIQSNRSSVVFRYPPGEPDAIDITQDDVDTLVDGGHLSDGIVDFYSLVLLGPDMGVPSNIATFTSLFATLLMQNRASALASLANQASSTFERDFWVMAVVQHGHWCLAIVVRPDELATRVIKLATQGGSVGRGTLVNNNSVLVILDPKRGGNDYRGLKKALADWMVDRLHENNETVDKAVLRSLVGKALPLRHVRVPQQSDSSSCGLFVLGFWAAFIHGDDETRSLMCGLTSSTKKSSVWTDFMSTLPTRKDIITACDKVRRQGLKDNADKAKSTSSDGQAKGTVAGMVAAAAAALAVARRASPGRADKDKPSGASGKGKGVETEVKKTTARNDTVNHASSPHVKEDGRAGAGDKNSDGGTVDAAAATAAAAAVAKAANASSSRADRSVPGGVRGKSKDIKTTAAAAAKARNTSAPPPHAEGDGPACVDDADMDVGTGAAAAPAGVTPAANAPPAHTDDAEPGGADGVAKDGGTAAAAAAKAAATDASPSRSEGGRSARADDKDMDMGTAAAAAPDGVTSATNSPHAHTDDVEPSGAGGTDNDGGTVAAAAAKAAATDASPPHSEGGGSARADDKKMDTGAPAAAAATAPTAGVAAPPEASPTFVDPDVPAGTGGGALEPGTDADAMAAAAAELACQARRAQATACTAGNVNNSAEDAAKAAAAAVVDGASLPLAPPLAVRKPAVATRGGKSVLLPGASRVVSLFWRISNAEPEAVETLLHDGVDANSVVGGTLPLLHAVEMGQRESISLLLRARADPNLASGRRRLTPLLVAVRKRDEVVLQALLTGGALANLLAPCGLGCVRLAVSVGSLSILKILLDAGAAADQCGLDGWTPLLEAAYRNNVVCASELVRRGADVNRPDRSGVVPLYVAAAAGRTELVHLLVQAGGDLILPVGRSSPLLAAASAGHHAMLKSWWLPFKKKMAVLRDLQDKKEDMVARLLMDFGDG